MTAEKGTGKIEQNELSCRKRGKRMKKEFYSMAECEHLIEEVLGRGGTFRFYPRGTSMNPFIYEGKDMVVLSPISGQVKKYQAVLYKRESGAFVLHRVVGIQNGSYTMRGDYQFVSEPGIRRGQMIGVVTGIIRGGHEIDVSEIRYRMRVWLWVHTIRVRRYVKAVQSRAKKIVKKLLYNKNPKK